MTLSNASKRWVLRVTLLVYLDQENYHALLGWLAKRLPTQGSLMPPRGASIDMTSGPIDRSGAGNRALVS
jgi:hypothetical protein